MQAQPDPRSVVIMFECPSCREEVKDGTRKCPHCHEWLIPLPVEGKTEMLAGDRNELAERRAAENVRTHVEKELIKRYMGIGLIVAALTGGTVTLVVKSNVDSALLGTHQRLAATEALQQRNLKTLEDFDKAMLRMKDLDKNLKDLSTSASDTEKTFKGLQASATSLRQDQFASSKDLLDLAGKLEDKIGTLASVVRGFELDSATAQLVETLVAKTSTIPQVLDRAEKRRYPIGVTNRPNAAQLVDALSANGYSASINTSGSQDEKIYDSKDFEMIWISEKVPYDLANDVIGTALTFFPNLRYVHIAADFDEGLLENNNTKIYLGAATEWANRIRLQALPVDFFPSLFAAKSQDEFHTLIRLHYAKPVKEK